jgi:hypothetical protein
MAMNLEMYDNLKGEIGDKAARVIAEAIPPRDQLATKGDIEGLRAAISALATEFKHEMALLESRLDGRLDRQSAEIMRWMLTFFVPLWLGVYGTLAAVIITLIIRG